MRLVLLGPPGAGKGTQANLLCDAYSLAHISTGDILRQSLQKDDDFSREIQKVMESGLLVSDDIIIRLISDRIKLPDCASGYVLDGFPRTIEQAKALLELGVELDYVIEIVVPDENIVERMSGRRIHPASARVYHVENKPPKTPDIDDITGEPLVQRVDDAPDTVLARLKMYHDQTSPLNSFFKSLSVENQLPIHISIDGTASSKQVHAAIVKAISNA